jgi:hypothetical protein
MRFQQQLTQIAGTVSVQQPGLRRVMANPTLPSTITGTLDITGIKLTDPYLWIVVIGAGNGIWISTVTGDQSGIVYPVNDVASAIHFAQVPLTGLDTSITIAWTSLKAALPTGPVLAIFAAQIPVNQPTQTGFTIDNIAIATTVSLTWFTSLNLGLPVAIRLTSAEISIHTAAATATALLQASGHSLIVAGAPNAGDASVTCSFGKLIIANGALTNTGDDFSAQNLAFVTTAAATSLRCLTQFEVLAFA